MQNRKRLTNILIASTLTVFLLAVFLAFRSNDTAVAETNSNVVDETAVIELQGNYEADIATLQAQIETLKAQNEAYASQNEELRTAVTTLQERETEYQTQIAAANQTINELSAQNSSATVGGTGTTFQAPSHGHNH
ncbi:MAG: hypothetical protein KC413_06075 [Anaerolineales bacterium]|nr:hypothetical protein [Anaerolineales bacterium]MCB8965781.1 hypothetical protein [Ardenticatenaceae bacterium]